MPIQNAAGEELFISAVAVYRKFEGTVKMSVPFERIGARNGCGFRLRRGHHCNTGGGNRRRFFFAGVGLVSMPA